MRQPTQWTAEQWLRLVDFLSDNVRDFLAEKRGSFSSLPIPPEFADQPPVLIDISIPKTMRSQKELVIVTDLLGDDITWRRLDDGAMRGEEGCIMGISIDRSPIYRIFGTTAGGPVVSPLLVRMFARPDLFRALRQQLDPSLVLTWLKSWNIE